MSDRPPLENRETASHDELVEKTTVVSNKYIENLNSPSDARATVDRRWLSPVNDSEDTSSFSSQGIKAQSRQTLVRELSQDFTVSTK